MERAAPAPAPAPHKFRIAVAGYPGVSMMPVLQLLKAAVLYGDEVLLHSPLAGFVASLSAFAFDASDPDLFARALPYAVALDPSLGPTYEKICADAKVRNVRELIGLTSPRSVRGSRLPPRAKRELVHSLDQMREGILDITDAQLRQAGYAEVEAAFSAGVLRLLPLEAPDDAVGEDWLAEQFWEGVGRLLDDAGTYPMFDDQLTDLMRTVARHSGTPMSATAGLRTAHAASAETFIGQLTHFPAATMDELVDIRADLSAPLVRFRSAMAKLSRGLGVGILDPEFDHVARMAWIETVAPALLELEEISQERGLVRTYGVEAMTGGLLTGAATLLAAGLTGQDPLIKEFITAAAAIGVTAARGSQKRRDAAHAIERHPYYFLHQANSLLGAASSTTR